MKQPAKTYLKVDNKHYRIAFTQQGIFIVEKVNDTQERRIFRLPSSETKYNLIYAILDGLGSRFLAHDFSWAHDRVAHFLRIAFALLVPKLDIGNAKFLRPVGKFANTPLRLTTVHFNLLKRALDTTGGAHGKPAFKATLLGLKNDQTEQYTLHDYLSEDSEHSDTHEPNEDEPAHSRDGDDDSRRRHTHKRTKLSALQTRAGHKAFMRYLRGDSPNVPKKVYNVPDEKIDATTREAVNRTLERSAVDATLQPGTKLSFNDDNQLVDESGKVVAAEQILIPGFRGVNHMPARFSDNVRRVLRRADVQESKTSSAYFSEAVLKSQFDFYQDAERVLRMYNTDSALYDALLAQAKILQQQLLNLQQVQHILVQGHSSGPRLFGNLLEVLQDLYTNGIIRFQRMLRDIQQELPFEFSLPNAYNPFVSESESPYHAIRYGFGQKNPYEPAALRPRYRPDGRASYPYLGEIQITLRDVLTVTTHDGRRLLVRERKSAATLKASYTIGAELEATALSFLPEGQVVHSEVLRCPNFSGEYKPMHRKKYGFDKAMYDYFKTKITESQQGTPERAAALEALLEWLCNFHTVRLMKKTKSIARRKRATLAFLNKGHGISETMPDSDVPLSSDLNMRKAQIASALLAKRPARGKHKVEPFLETQVTTTKMKMFAITEDEIRAAAAETRKPGKTIRITKAEVNELLRGDEILRTPPSQDSKPRTPIRTKSSSRRDSGTPFRYGSQEERFAFCTPVTFAPPQAKYQVNEHDWYTGEQVTALLTQMPLQEGDLMLAPIDALQHHGERIAVNLYDQVLLQAYRDNLGDAPARRMILPINLGNRHWVTLLLEYPTENRLAPTVRYFDPLAEGMPYPLETALRRVFTGLAPNVQFDIAEARLQFDGYNCGPWMIEIIRSLLNNTDLPTPGFDIETAREQHQHLLTQLAQLNHGAAHPDNEDGDGLAMAGADTEQPANQSGGDESSDSDDLSSVVTKLF